MAKADWGLKRICPHCGTRYYDMKKKQPTCPSCGAAFDADALIKSRRGRAVVEEKPKKQAPQAEHMEDLPLVEDGENENPAIEDADELGEDDVDVEEVIEVEEENDEAR